jgi:hypothetical protein
MEYIIKVDNGKTTDTYYVSGVEEALRIVKELKRKGKVARIYCLKSFDWREEEN